MVAHHILDVLSAQELLGLYPKGHFMRYAVDGLLCLGINVLAHGIGQIGFHVLGSPLVEETPYACLAIALGTEIYGSVCLGEGEVLVLAGEVTLLACERDDIF